MPNSPRFSSPQSILPLRLFVGSVFLLGACANHSAKGGLTESVGAVSPTATQTPAAATSALQSANLSSASGSGNVPNTVPTVFAAASIAMSSIASQSGDAPPVASTASSANLPAASASGGSAVPDASPSAGASGAPTPGSDSSENGTGAVPNSGEPWIPLFNGVDLEGWTPKFAGSPAGVNYNNTFRVEDGMLVVAYDEYSTWNGEFGHLFYNEQFSHYVIRAEYRFVGEQVAGGVSWGLLNNGLMIHSQSPESMALDQQFPVSIEVKLFAQPNSISGNVCTPGTDVRIDGQYTGNQHCIDTTTFHHGANEWVTIEAEVHGNTRIIHRQNGMVTAEYTEPKIDPNDPNEERVYAKQLLDAGAEPLLSQGYIAIQSETHPTQFRKIEIQLLDP